MTIEDNPPQQENKGKLERFVSLIDAEKFSEAKNLAQEILATGDELTKPVTQAMLNHTGYGLVSQYLNANSEKARRICQAFLEYSWPNWLK